jgi:hypothetical protein
MNEKWLAANERTNERSSILFVETPRRNRVVRPGVVFFRWMNEKLAAHEPTNAAFCAWKRHCGITSSVRPSVRPGGFLFG